MIPTTSRRVFVLSLSTIFLLGFLWYKRKRTSQRSDPGGTGLNVRDKTEINCPANQDSSITAHQDITSAEVKPKLQLGKSVVEKVHTTTTAPLDAAIDIGCVVNQCELVGKLIDECLACCVEVQEVVNKCVAETAHEEIDNNDFCVETKVKIKNSEPLVGGVREELYKNPAAVKVVAEIITDTSSEVLEKECEEIITSIFEAAIDVKGVELMKGLIEEVPIIQTSKLNPNATDFILNTFKYCTKKDYLEETCADTDTAPTAQCCDFQPTDKISKVELITEKVFANTTNFIGPAVDSRILTEDVQPHCVSEEVEVTQGCTKVTSSTFQNHLDLAPKISWASEIELESDDDKLAVEFIPKTEDTINSLDRSTSSVEMARESSTDVDCDAPTIEDSVTERKLDNGPSSLESKLSALHLEEPTPKCGGTDKTKIVKERRGIERDSANHSPADVMLESPSISNYSDAQSEGSSDSGKGGSDVATPPSRTPASGSSVAGDLPLSSSVYEFVLPQILVGRLIGRHGVVVHQIKAKTNANIFIKRHPETAKMKICAIEGTPMDIESALEMIRQKFPPKRYPNVTLEQVSFLPPVATLPLATDSFQVPLIEGVNNDVILSSLVSPAHFFLQQPTHPTYPALNRLNMCMSLCYNEPNAPLLPLPIKEDVICVAPTMGGWFRAQVVATDPENETCDVRFLDYGGYLNLEQTALRQIRQDFLTLPFQAVECYLANVKPTNGIWMQDAVTYIEELTQGQVIQAQIYGYAENGIPVVYLFSIQGSVVVVVNNELVNRGYAEYDEPTEDEVSASVEGEVLTTAQQDVNC